MTHGHKALDLWEVKCEGEIFLIIVFHNHRGHILNSWTAWERVGYARSSKSLGYVYGVCMDEIKKL